MTKQEILEKVSVVFKTVFKDNTTLTMDTVLKDVKSWDSMGHMMFLSKLQDTFKIKFQMNDFISLKSIGQIVDAIDRLQPSK